MRTLVLLLSAMLVGCSGEAGDKTTPGDDDDDDTDTTAEVETADTAGTSSAGIDIVAVGFEVMGIIEADGSFGPFVLDGYEYPPQVIITFTDLEYFSLAAEAQAGHFCTANGFFGTSDGTVYDVVPPSLTPLTTRSEGVLLGEPGTDFDNALLSGSYDVALLIDTTTHDCGNVVDPALWGESAELLVEPFNGAHFGFGFGQLTDYMRAGWSEKTLDEFGPSMVTEYIAINDANGDFQAYDWSTSLLWQSDPDTNEVLFEADGKTYLGPVPVDFLPPGAALPEAYVVSYALWYQDFQAGVGSNGIDLTNLRDGAP